LFQLFQLFQLFHLYRCVSSCIKFGDVLGAPPIMIVIAFWQLSATLSVAGVIMG